MEGLRVLDESTRNGVGEAEPASSETCFRLSRSHRLSPDEP